MKRITRAAAASLALLLTTTGCSDDGGGDGAVARIDLGARPAESAAPATDTPVRGGQLVYALEGDVTSLCLPEGQLAIAGMQIARAIYDPLVIPNDKGGYSPYLAKSVEPSADFKTWTITLREGITFHNGEKLDAELVKDNLDAFRGAPGSPRSSLLMSFVFQDIAAVQAVDPTTVRITTKRPWVAFPASLYAGGRVAILAREQLEADKDTCDRVPIGTGPFELVTWESGGSVRLARNADYWIDAPDGEPYPYANAVEFRFMPNDGARISALQRGDINVMHSSASGEIASTMAQLKAADAINLIVSQDQTETAYYMLNATHEPFDTLEGRVAAAQAIDRERIIREANGGLPTPATGPYAPDVLGFLEDNGAPKYDLEAAKKAVQSLKDQGKNTSITILGSTNPSSIRQSVLAKEMLEQAGFTVQLEVEVQSALINRAIAGEFDMATFRNQPGDDPDVNSIWWYGGGVLNFGKFSDPAIDELLDQGRVTADAETRQKVYEDVNRRLGTQAYNIWLFFQPWAVALSPNVHGVLGPKLPNGDQPTTRLANGHSMVGIWIDNQTTAG
ncbi:MAG: ABC transporter substrate-binding protein [Acidimicrobiales bacterium]|jgi:peptide/nickel transport system substrate-binding protein|nr:ABC transporter substrate-binding protein [Acidimicrobiales bacterium]HMS87655.1 ABC transporter substrate-binding protein [Acidimicrobiales bacterium]